MISPRTAQVGQRLDEIVDVLEAFVIGPQR